MTHRDDVVRESVKRQHESPSAARKRLRREQQEQRDEQETIDEAFALYNINDVGRETVGGRVTVVANLEPKPRFRPRTDDRRISEEVPRQGLGQRVRPPARSAGGRGDRRCDVWVGNDRTRAQGARAVFERTKVNDEVWLPARTSFTATGRALLFRTFAIDSVTTVLRLQEVQRHDRRGVREAPGSLRPRASASVIASTS